MAVGRQLRVAMPLAFLAASAIGCSSSNNPLATLPAPFGHHAAAPAVTLAPRAAGTHFLVSKSLILEVVDPASTATTTDPGEGLAPLAWIVRAQYQGHDFVGATLLRGASRPAGLGMEFDAASEQGPPGFQVAAIGGTYVKVGVGEFRKIQAVYDPLHPGELVRRFATTVAWRDDEATFTQLSTPVAGQQYELKAKLMLKDNRLVIMHTLRNLGHQPLTTEVSAANAFGFDEAAVGPGWIVTFPYVPGVGAPPAPLREAGQELRVQGAVTAPLAVTVAPAAGYQEGGWVSITSTSQGLQAYTRCSLPVVRTEVAMTSHLVAASQVTALTVAPGATLSWTRTYVFSLQSGDHAP